MVFTAKNVDAPHFGEKLKRLRQEAGLSVNRAAQILNIQIACLENLEKGEIEKMPAEVYVKGILRKYAEVLKIDAAKIIEQYEQEVKIARHLNKTSSHLSLPTLSSRRLVITPRFLSLFVISLAILLVFSYFIYQLNFLIGAPPLSLSAPKDNLITSQTDVKVIGQTDRGAQISINGQPILADMDGVFEKEINLNYGLNVITVEAISRFGKKNLLSRQIMVSGSPPVVEPVATSSAIEIIE